MATKRKWGRYLRGEPNYDNGIRCILPTASCAVRKAIQAADQRHGELRTHDTSHLLVEETLHRSGGTTTVQFYHPVKLMQYVLDHAPKPPPPPLPPADIQVTSPMSAPPSPKLAASDDERDAVQVTLKRMLERDKLPAPATPAAPEAPAAPKKTKTTPKAKTTPTKRKDCQDNACEARSQDALHFVGNFTTSSDVYVCASAVLVMYIMR